MLHWLPVYYQVLLALHIRLQVYVAKRLQQTLCKHHKSLCKMFCAMPLQGIRSTLTWRKPNMLHVRLTLTSILVMLLQLASGTALLLLWLVPKLSPRLKATA